MGCHDDLRQLGAGRHHPGRAGSRPHAEGHRYAPYNRISAATYVEIGIVVDSKRNPVASRRLDDFLTRSRFTIEPFTEQQARIARDAYRDFGKGSGHPAKLNLGDGFSYALAQASGEPLLFKGNDFSRTGIASALSADGRP